MDNGLLLMVLPIREWIFITKHGIQHLFCHHSRWNLVEDVEDVGSINPLYVTRLTCFFGHVKTSCCHV